MKCYAIHFQPAGSGFPQVYFSDYLIAESPDQALLDSINDGWLVEAADHYWGDTPYEFSRPGTLIPNDEDDYWYGECYRTDVEPGTPEADDPPFLTILLLGDLEGEPTVDDDCAYQGGKNKTRFHFLLDLYNAGYNPGEPQFDHFRDRDAFLEWAAECDLTTITGSTWRPE